MRLIVRPMRPRVAPRTPDSPPDDQSFVVESWIASFRHRPPIVAVGDWHGVMSLAISKILARPEVKVIMAADADAEPGIADLLGWMAYETRAVERAYDEGKREYRYRRVPPAERAPGMDPLVWYVNVKADYRGHGIARRLFSTAGIDPRDRFHFVCETRAVGQLTAAGKIPRATLRPNLGRLDERGPYGRRSEDHDADAA